MITFESLKNPPFVPTIIKRIPIKYKEQQNLLDLIYNGGNPSGKQVYSNHSLEWKENRELASIDVYLNDNLEWRYEKFFLVPIKVKIQKLYEAMDIPNEFNIYSKDNFFDLLMKYNENYQFFIQVKKEAKIIEKEIIDFENFNYEKNIIMKFRQYISKEKFNELILYENIPFLSNQTTNILEIDIEKMIPNFEYFSTVKKCKLFKLIINKKRLALIDKINKFCEQNNKKIFWLMGKDGIGKTITLQYFTILKKNQKAIYINLKLLFDSGEDINKLKKIFFKEVAKYFCGEPEEMNYEEKKMKTLYSKYKNIQYNINNKLNSLSGIRDKNFAWLIIKYLIEEISTTPCLIILDQYNSYYCDKECENLNNLLFSIINKFKLIKILLSSSIDNYEIKDFFLKNINNIDVPEDFGLESEEDNLEESESNVSENEIKEENENIFSDENEEKETFSEYDYYEDQINQQRNFIKERKNLFPPSKNYNFSNKYNFEKNNFININRNKLNNEYFNSLVDCEILFQNEDKEKEIGEQIFEKLKDMISNFNYSIKTYYEFLDFKEQQEQYNNNSNDISKIIEKFYSNVYNHFKTKINQFYKSINSNDDNLKYQELYKLKNMIYFEVKFNLSELGKVLINCPMEYLNIVVYKNKEENNINLDKFEPKKKFLVKYSNKFVEFAFDYLYKEHLQSLNSIPFYKLTNSGFGSYLEIDIKNSILEGRISCLKLIEIKLRNIFALVGKTQNSENTVNNNRENERKSLLYKQFNIKHYDVLIDDIDKIDNQTLLNSENYLINQVSENGKIFDIAILIYKGNSLENSKNKLIFDLYLIQITKYKKNLKTKKQYINNGKKAKEYIEKTYDIIISENNFLFILPFGDDKTKKLEQKLNEQGIKFIFYDILRRDFCDVNGNIIGKQEDLSSHFLEDELVLDSNLCISKSLNAINYCIAECLKKQKKFKETYIKYLNSIFPSFQRLRLSLNSSYKISITQYILNNGLLTVRNKRKLRYLFLFNTKLDMKIINEISSKNILIIFKYCGKIIGFFHKLFEINPKEIKNLDENLKLKLYSDLFESNLSFTKAINKKIAKTNIENMPENIAFCFFILF